MIATNETDSLPAVLFPVAWPATEWNRTPLLLERVRAGVSDYWGVLASLVELARIPGVAGVLRVTLEPRHAVAFRQPDGGTWMAANAMAVWMRELPSRGAFLMLPGSAQVDIHEPPTDRDVSVVCSVLEESAPATTNTAVGRVSGDRSHAEWLAHTLVDKPDFAELPYVMLVEMDLADGVQL